MLLQSSATDGVTLSMPPSGAWFEQLPDGFRVGATTRSAMAVFYIPFTGVWAGISMFGVYGTQLSSGHFDWKLSLFGVPFVLGSFFLISLTLMCLAGQTVLTRSGDQIKLFSGIGPLGVTRTYAWSDFNSVREDFLGSTRNSRRGSLVVAMEGKRRITFGTMWTSDRRNFVIFALREMLINSGNFQAGAIIPVR